MSFNLLSIYDGTHVLSDAGQVAIVCLMGIGIVFIGLICIILLCSLLAAIFKNTGNKVEENKPLPTVQNKTNSEPIANKQEFIAAVSAAIAEDMGKDISAIRIKSIKKLG